jgi:hypothetical protein
MQRGSTTAAVAAMDAAGAVPAAIVGLLLLGDRIDRAASGWPRSASSCTLAAVIGLTGTRSRSTTTRTAPHRGGRAPRTADHA